MSECGVERRAEESAATVEALCNRIEQLLAHVSVSRHPPDPALAGLERDLDRALARARTLGAGSFPDDETADAWLAWMGALWRRLEQLQGGSDQVLRLKAKGVLLGACGEVDRLDLGPGVVGRLAVEVIASVAEAASA